MYTKLLKAPYGGNTADPHFLDALRDCYEQVWIGAAHGALGFDGYEEGLAGCEERIETGKILCTYDLGRILVAH